MNSRRCKYILLIAFLCVGMLSQNGFADEHSNLAIGGDFTLTDHNGEQFELEQLRGKLVLVFFGYTYCPDVCPLELSSLAKVLRSVDEHADKVKALFISVDPARDTPEVLKQYVSFFSADLIGLTGSLSEINKVTNAYHVQRKIRDYKGSEKNYLVDHSANLYVIGGDGKMLKIIPFGMPIEHMQQVVKEEIQKLGKPG